MSHFRAKWSYFWKIGLSSARISRVQASPDVSCDRSKSSVAEGVAAVIDIASTAFAVLTFVTCTRYQGHMHARSTCTANLNWNQNRRRRPS